VAPSPTLRTLVKLALVHIPVALIRFLTMFKDIANGRKRSKLRSNNFRRL
jgi:hypothetical protein